MSIPEIIEVAGVVVAVVLAAVTVLAVMATFGADRPELRRRYALFALFVGALTPLVYHRPVEASLVLVALVALALIKEVIRPTGGKP